MPLRVGGAFLALSAVLLLFGFVALFSDGWMSPFEITWRFLLTSVAAALVGAFITTSAQDKGSPAQIVGLVVAIALVVSGRFAPSEPLGVMAPYWLFLYAGAALLCALVIRRSLMPKA